MQIIEIYKSLQGESSYAGLPCIFVRLAGCNLRCSWCDSEYTFKGGSRMTLDEIEAEVRRLSPNGGLVEITGGEPLLQEREAVPLMERLLAAGYTRSAGNQRRASAGACTESSGEDCRREMSRLRRGRQLPPRTI